MITNKADMFINTLKQGDTIKYQDNIFYRLLFTEFFLVYSSQTVVLYTETELKNLLEEKILISA